METPQDPLTIRERVSIHLLLLAVKLIKPYQFEHQFKDTIENIHSLLNEKEEKLDKVDKV